MTETTTEGLRYNGGKTRYDLIPFDGLEALADVYTRGAEKYAERNWEKGMGWMVMFASLMRHTAKWCMGEDYDKESGQLHMAHVAWNALGLVTYQLRNIGTDDRIKLQGN